MEALTGATRRGAHHLRHVQGAVARHPHRRGAAADQVRRQARGRAAAAADCASAARDGASLSAPLYGLVLAGGRSPRMQRDKAGTGIRRPARSSRARWTLLRAAGRALLRVGARATSCTIRCAPPTRRSSIALPDLGPDRRHPRGAAGAPGRGLAGAGLRPAVPRRRDAAAADRARATGSASRTAFRSSHDGMPEPLCAIYEPAQPRAPSTRGSQPASNCPRNSCAGRSARCSIAARPARARQHQHRRRNTGWRARARRRRPARIASAAAGAVLRAAARAGRAAARRPWPAAAAHAARAVRTSCAQRHGLTLRAEHAARRRQRRVRRLVAARWRPATRWCSCRRWRADEPHVRFQPASAPDRPPPLRARARRPGLRRLRLPSRAGCAITTKGQRVARLEYEAFERAGASAKASASSPRPARASA